MRIRTLIEREHEDQRYRSGQLMDVPDDVSQAWIDEGTAETESMSAYRSFEAMESLSREQVAELAQEEADQLQLARSGVQTAVEPNWKEARKAGGDSADEPKPEVEDAARTSADGEPAATARRTTKRSGRRAETAAEKQNEERG